MSRKRKFLNPFFVLLGLVGSIFFLSAFLYGVQMFRAARNWAEREPIHPLMHFFQEHGTTVLVIELAVLAVLTVSAIWTDDYWAQRNA